MEKVYAVIEYLPIGAAGAGAGGEHVHSEHPEYQEAAMAKQQLCFRRPELIGCLTIRAQASKVVVTKQEPKGEEGDARPVAGGAGDGGDRVAGKRAGGGPRPPV